VDEQQPPRAADRPVRVEDVARVAAVSPITVSRALRTPEKVKAETLERVLEAVRKTGYQVNSIASSLRSGQSTFVSVFVASLQNLHYAAAMQGVIDAFETSRYQLLFAQPGYAEDLAADRLRAMLPFRPGAIVFGGVVRDEGARAFLKSLDVPVIEMWGDAADPIDMLVRSPGYEGGLLLGDHIGSQGFAHIAYIGHTGSRAMSRIAGLAAGLARHGQKISHLVPVEGTTEMEDGIAMFEQVRAQFPDCDAMLFGTDVMAAGGIVRAAELGVPVPGEIAIAGYGDLFFAAHTVPGLTSVHTDPYLVGRTTGDLLRARLEGRPGLQRVVEVPLHLAARGSTMRK
jgi:LacI family transcriptional regulator, gluconate utilization system Gnt-I transcriptional repressor